MNRKSFNRVHVMTAILSAALLALGVSPARAAEQNGSTVDKTYLLEKEPKEAADVAAVRKDAKDRDDVVVVGRVGGRKSPWVKGAAAFSIVDRSLKPCSALPGDTCPTPWDYCCEADLPKFTLLVLVQDADAKLIKKDARELLGLKELDTVYVQGKVKRDKSGNVSILASRFFVVDDTQEGQKEEAK